MRKRCTTTHRCVLRTERTTALQTVQAEAMNSARWFEDLPRYVEGAPSQFPALLERRRSPLMAHLPISVYVRLSRFASAAPTLTRPITRALLRARPR